MKRRIGTPNKAQQARQDRVREMGCICCSIEGGYRPAELHHINDCGRNIGHDATIPLCAWHHRGAGPGIGPSLANGKRVFVERYGTELELLEIVDGRLTASASSSSAPAASE